MPRKQKEVKDSQVSKASSKIKKSNSNRDPKLIDQPKHGSKSISSEGMPKVNKQKSTKRKSNTEVISVNEVETAFPREETGKKHAKRSNDKLPSAEVETSTQTRSATDKAAIVPYGYEKPTRVEFVEENQIINMKVDQDQNYSDEDAVDYEDDVSDHEISFKENRSNHDTTTETESDDSSDEEAEISQGRSSQSTELAEQPSSSQERELRDSVVNLSEPERRIKMREINKEMKQKLLELQSMMRKGGYGMEESIQEAQKTLELLEQGRKCDNL